MSDITPKSQAKWNRVAKREINILTSKVDRLTEENEYLKGQLYKKNIPDKVRAWMDEYRICWEAFWCYEHEEWMIELDNLFPYHMEDCACSKCNQQ
jgi:hypothetical protein